MPPVAPVKSILLVDDDIELCALMEEFFRSERIRIESAHDGREGLAKALIGNFELILLDVMLPVLDGFEVLRQIRKRSSVPVIMLTARTAQDDRVRGLDTGADDYLPKPFGAEELLARIRAVLRRSGKFDSASQIIEAGGLKLDPQSRNVSRQGKPLTLTSIQFDILEILMRSAGRVVSRNEVTAILYQRESTPYERSLDVHISHLRRKIESHGRPLIRTVRGVGYLFSAALPRLQ